MIQRLKSDEARLRRTIEQAGVMLRRHEQDADREVVREIEQFSLGLLDVIDRRAAAIRQKLKKA